MKRPDDFNTLWSDMVEGRRYDASDPRLGELLMKTRLELQKFNNLPSDNLTEQRRIIRELLGSTKENFHFNQPFRCDYGCNIHIGDFFFANFNLTILDEAEVRIGNYCFIGPNVSMYTACHPLEVADRNEAIEWAEPIRIGHNVWIGGSVTILPGVTIGDNVVIGAGSVVSRDIPSDSLALGNPARVVRSSLNNPGT